MQFKDLIIKYNFKDIKKRLIEIYPDQKKCLRGYKDVFEILKKKRNKQSELSISLSLVKEKEGDPWVNISGIEKGEPYGFAIEFTPWAEWLGMKIERKTLKSFSEIDILCYCLWEMTWSGFTEKRIQGTIKEMQTRVDNVESGKAKFISWEEGMKELKK